MTTTRGDLRTMWAARETLPNQHQQDAFTSYVCAYLTVSVDAGTLALAISTALDHIARTMPQEVSA